LFSAAGTTVDVAIQLETVDGTMDAELLSLGNAGRVSTLETQLPASQRQGVLKKGLGEVLD
jgi:hypothetical protein